MLSSNIHILRLLYLIAIALWLYKVKTILMDIFLYMFGLLANGDGLLPKLSAVGGGVHWEDVGALLFITPQRHIVIFLIFRLTLFYFIF